MFFEKNVNLTSHKRPDYTFDDLKPYLRMQHKRWKNIENIAIKTRD